jgi:hypothetical protein
MGLFETCQAKYRESKKKGYSQTTDPTFFLTPSGVEVCIRHSPGKGRYLVSLNKNKKWGDEWWVSAKAAGKIYEGSDKLDYREEPFDKEVEAAVENSAVIPGFWTVVGIKQGGRIVGFINTAAVKEKGRSFLASAYFVLAGEKEKDLFSKFPSGYEMLDPKKLAKLSTEIVTQKVNRASRPVFHQVANAKGQGGFWLVMGDWTGAPGPLLFEYHKSRGDCSLEEALARRSKAYDLRGRY